MGRCGRLKLQKLIFLLSFTYRLRVVEVEIEKGLDIVDCGLAQLDGGYAWSFS